MDRAITRVTLLPPDFSEETVVSG